VKSTQHDMSGDSTQLALLVLRGANKKLAEKIITANQCSVDLPPAETSC